MNCAGGSDGVLIVTATGGDGSYEYSLDGVTFQSSPTFTGLMAGTHTVTTRDGNGCLITCTALITELPALMCSALPTAVTDCGVDDGTISVTAVGGTAAYSFDAGAGTVSANVINDLAPGTYVVTVTDANGCTTTCAAEVMSLNLPSCTIGDVVNVACSGDATGSFIVAGMGGNSTAYEFTDGTTTNTDGVFTLLSVCLLYTSPSPRDATLSRMPSSA